ncbi:tetratricopeptide repeat protein [Phreatobacter sp.]|uniref:tetratricopeptide repeat protein n=1 Tax=Phreatobacter sp. TaxID=1966341 RepID=UPI0022CCFF7E|nr:tetratricopeptide repeat protein [Phreatobacter sp.]MCZ8315335.1 tetratricopeptide repeat protein [Phreatobacter sp.]
MTRAAVFLFALLGTALGGAASHAQTTGPVPTPPSEAAPAAGAITPPALASERARRLDELYSRLREAENARQARVLEAQIGMLMSVSGSDTADLLMGRAQQAMQQRQADLALSLLDAVIDLQPDFTEAWSRRATLYFARREFGRALSDLENVLRLEPRHFGAMVGLGMLLQQLGDEKGALTAFQQAMEVNPHIERVPQIIQRLKPKVDGVEL